MLLVKFQRRQPQLLHGYCILFSLVAEFCAPSMHSVPAQLNKHTFHYPIILTHKIIFCSVANPLVSPGFLMSSSGGCLFITIMDAHSENDFLYPSLGVHKVKLWFKLHISLLFTWTYKQIITLSYPHFSLSFSRGYTISVCTCLAKVLVFMQSSTVFRANSSYPFSCGAVTLNIYPVTIIPTNQLLLIYIFHFWSLHSPGSYQTKEVCLSSRTTRLLLVVPAEAGRGISGRGHRRMGASGAWQAAVGRSNGLGGPGPFAGRSLPTPSLYLFLF